MLPGVHTLSGVGDYVGACSAHGTAAAFVSSTTRMATPTVLIAADRDGLADGRPEVSRTLFVTRVRGALA
jgi:hypothetical protein